MSNKQDIIYNWCMVSVDKQVNEKSQHFKFFLSPQLCGWSLLARQIQNIEADSKDNKKPLIAHTQVNLYVFS